MSMKVSKTNPSYKQLTELLRQVDEKKVDLAVQDDIMTYDEILSIVDHDDNGFDVGDLKTGVFATNAKLFGQINDVLNQTTFEGTHQSKLSCSAPPSLFSRLPYHQIHRGVHSFINSGWALESLLYCVEFLQLALKKDGLALRFVPEEIWRENRDLLGVALYQNPAAIQYISEDDLFNDPGPALTATLVNGNILQLITEELQLAFPNIVHAALMNDPQSFRFVSPAFQLEHPEIVEIMWGILGDDMLMQIDPEFWDKHPESHRLDWESLRNQPMDFENPDSMLAWLTLDGMMLDQVPEAVQKKWPEIVDAALLQNPEALRFVAESLLDTSVSDVVSFAYFAVSENPILYYATKAVQIASSEFLKGYMVADPNNLSFLHPDLAKEKPADYFDAIVAALEHDGLMLDKVPSHYLKTHPELNKVAVRQNPKALEFSDPNWQLSDPDTVRGSINFNIKVFQFLNPLFYERHFNIIISDILSMLESGWDPYNITLLPEAILIKYPQLVSYAIHYSRMNDPRINHGDLLLDHLSDAFLQKHPDILMEAISRDVRNALALIRALNDPSQPRNAIYLEGFKSRSDYSEPLMDYLAWYFINESVGLIIPLMSLNRALLDEFWEKIKRQTHHLIFPDGVMDSAESFFEFLSEYTAFPERFHKFETVHRLFVVNKDDPFDDRPVVLLLHNKDDYNGAFASKLSSQRGTVVDALAADERYHVIYREIDSDQDVIPALETFGPVQTLVLAGHGTKTTLQLSHARSHAREDESLVDTADFDQCDGKSSDYFQPGAQILLYACSNGEGGAHGENLQRSIADTYPGVEVVSSPVPANIIQIFFQKNGHLHVNFGGTKSVSSKAD